jgi:hypothetical protein
MGNKKETPMARPPIAESSRRTRFINVRVSAAEELVLRARAKAAGVLPASYLREAGLGVIPAGSQPAPVISNAKAWGSLARVSANLNQIAKAIHTNKAGLPWPALESALIAVAATKKELAEVRELLLPGKVQG